MNLKCLIFGHKKYNPNALNGKDLINLNDSVGRKLVSINICERCGAVYSDLKKHKGYAGLGTPTPNAKLEIK